MRNSIRIALLTVPVAVAGSGALALDTTTNGGMITIPGTSCSVTFYIAAYPSFSEYIAKVELSAGGQSYLVSPYWDMAATTTVAVNPIDKTALALCHSVDVGSVLNFTMDGGDQGSWAEENYMGFSYTVGNTSYEYAWSGVSNTIMVAEAVVDDTAPTLTSSSPADDSQTVLASDNIELTFSEAITLGPGGFTLHKADGTQVEAFNVDSTPTTSGSTVTLNPTVDLIEGVSYYINVASDAVYDLANNAYAGIADSTTLNFTVPDITVPVVTAEQGFSYVEGQAADAVIGTVAATDNIGVTAFRFSDGAASTSADGYYSIGSDGSLTITAAGVAAGVENNDYQTGQNSFTYGIEAGDAAGNWSTAVNVTLSVTSSDTTAPTLSSSTPNDDSTGVAPSANIDLTFSEPIVAGTGNISLYKADGTPIQAFDVTKDVEISGSTITLNPSSDLEDSASYYIQIAATAVEDAVGNAYAGIDDNSTFNFTVVDTTAPTLSSSTPIDDATGVAPSANIDLTFSEPIAAGTGNISLYKADGTPTQAFDVTKDVEISGSTITLNPSSDLEEGESYYILIAATAVEDEAGNTYAGLAGSTTLNFTVADDTAPVVTAAQSFSYVENQTAGSEIGKVLATDTVGVTAYRFSTGASTSADGYYSIGSDGSLTITAAGAGANVNNYDYETGQNSVTYGIQAGDAADNWSTAVNVTLNVTSSDTTAPTVSVTGPTDIVTEAFDVTITFSEPVYNFELADVTVVQGTVTALTGAGDTYTATIDPVLGQTVKVSVAESMAADAAGNLNTASNEFAVSAGSPLSAFNTYTPQIRQAIVDDATRSLQSGLSSNRRMVQSARERFVEGQRERAACSEDDTGSGDDATCDPGLATRNSVPFDVDGTFALNGATLSTSGEFFEQTGNYEGTQRRLFFGDFDIQHDANTDSTTATITARVAWEQMTSDRTMLGYFIGGELARSTIDGAFEGDQDRLGLTVGGYAVHQFQDDLFLDGFLTLGAGRNNLDMANDDLALTSDYNTRTATIGAALSGVYEYEQYEFRPELSFSYGKTWIGNVGFTGRAYERVDDTLSLDAGNVAIANLTLRPEIVWALDADTVADSNSQFSFAPRLICERSMSTTRTENCGGGAELGLSSTSEDGLSNAEIRFVRDRVGNSYRSSFAVNLEHRF